ncbi:hypothetical protein IU500_23780 [Nocardia terpenica]|uniref:hypothetical protein n=1 Tax=Nocardia terpenica TaxID=455432 RepID=UPI001894AE2E|nr:hypothetical protein [Nocardia terpenica]MBF6063688.1 hypothetical protein [Nocardia terpenica]MBF6107064.1 hypothetical protein [Nocardia terpenica]MBF6114237.1 hypothetical protein [Nocardia terpenica]MBF6121676.1 hypothetical protein [Nocardia terpenica]MBF6154091.1 hypothetical protein [Nocardia terpenica]
MRMLLGAFALSTGAALVCMPIASARPDAGEANVAVLKVNHSNGDVTAAYECSGIENPKIEVTLTHKANGKTGDGETSDLTCDGEPHFVTFPTTLGAGKHGDKYDAKISLDQMKVTSRGSEDAPE